MAPRASSPALSETEYDIFDALAGGDDVRQDTDLNADLGLDLDVGNDDGSDDEAFIAARQAASNRKASNVGKSVKKGGGFQAMGLNAALLKAITQKGFKVPTPIQRKAVPLMLQGEDVVGMARTGSGKTAAFVIPMIQKLKAHSAKVGARGVIMSPSRELALQTLKVVKELGRGTDLRTILLVGGDSLEERKCKFSSMTTNPDIIIATPGRFLHLKVEMGLDLSSVKYIVFDEADRLFEMGFAAQLSEILHALPASRQTLLFSATLPKSLVEFARAGLQEPKLIRLDAESKISPDLKSAYFTIKSGDRDGALLHLLDNVIKVPVGETDAAKKAREESEKPSKKRKRNDIFVKDVPVAESTIIFAATKHRVEYLANLLRNIGYAISYVYGNLDQTARKEQIQDFRTGLTRILVVTDVAARGVDMPHINHVINYDFPSQPKIFVHRVGRTARAGRKGWAYSLCRHVDLPYLIDLQLFLGKRLLVGRSSDEPNYADDFVVGSLAPWQLESSVEQVNRQLSEDEDLALLLSVAEKGERQYQRTRNQASAQSVGRAKELAASPNFAETHMLFSDDAHNAQREKENMLARIQSFRPAETVFEIGKRGIHSETAEIMRKRREQVERQKAKQAANKTAEDDHLDTAHASSKEDHNGDAPSEDEVEAVEGLYDSDSDELEVSVSQPSSKKSKQDNWRNDDFFMSYTPKENLAEEKAYGVSGGDAGNTNFVSAARAAEMSLVNDEIQGFADAAKSKMRWDKKSKKYVNRTNDDDGSKGAKMIRGESGQKIAASFRSGRFDDWRKANKVKMPRVGEMEAPNRSAASFNNAPRYKHKAEKAPKQADRYRDDYHVQKKRVAEAKEKRIGAFKDGNAKNELRDVEAVRKNRKVQENRRAKNARPSKKRKH
ncbi:atp-dependent rna helicase dbp10 [Stemphylium lycopersici]|uniref:RNA helicase n=1 Tax=Stemphylium lycopersici TaxID=183478 RepID=A0A364N0W2_STELY|nr:atp-dependent rna helicase dbp10 [Stemphylium lycopersici]RAR07748.1 atp-dependent rna helicase dbp10 [Stemphylium lycopersici]RAR08528.1 atp-dependent rna helicase dbp10 [Stemphylium lycopersici]